MTLAAINYPISYQGIITRIAGLKLEHSMAYSTGAGLGELVKIGKLFPPIPYIQSSTETRVVFPDFPMTPPEDCITINCVDIFLRCGQ